MAGPDLVETEAVPAATPEQHLGLRTAAGLGILTVGAVAWVAHFSSRGFFFWDDFLYLRQAQLQGLTPRFLLERFPFNDHASPGHRLLDWLVQTRSPLNFGFAQAVLLVFVAASVVLVFAVVTELAGRGTLRWVLTALYATSTVQVAMVESFGNGELRLPSACLSLACIYGYLRHRRTGSRRALTWSVAALVGGLGFYIKALLVPVYLVGLAVLVLEPDRPLRSAAARVWHQEQRVWATYLVPVGAYLAVFVVFYWHSSPPPSLSALLHYLATSWTKGLVPSMAGLYVPVTGVSETKAALMVMLEVAFVGLVAWSVARNRLAWRAWCWFAGAFVLNALLVGLPLLHGLGPRIGYRLSYAMEATYLLPIAAAAAFGLPPARPAPEATNSARPARWRAAAWAVAVGALVAHLALAWSAAGATVADSTGPQTASYIHRVEHGLAAIERRGVRPIVVDGTVPDYVVTSYLLYGVPLPYNRYSELFPLVDPRVHFASAGYPLYQVAVDGTLTQVPIRVLDSFNRPDDPGRLGSDPGGPAWQAVTGTWGITGRQAYLSVPSAGGGVAVANVGRPVVNAEVRVADVAAGAGLVFAYRDPADYWAIEDEPYYGTWNIVQVQAGTVRGRGNVGLADTGNGTVVSATVHGSRATVTIDGRAARILSDPTLASGTGAGLVDAGGGAMTARFAGFRLTPASG